MNANSILAAVDAGEDKDWEFKSARGGMPGSVWETYSAMANTDGGVIVLGVKDVGRDEYTIEGLDLPAKWRSDFWNLVNNRQKVNVNLLADADLRTVVVDGRTLLAVSVPRAGRRQRPVFVGQNPLEGTFRRYGEGDFRCPPEEVGRMLADQSVEPADADVLSGFVYRDLDEATVAQYRNRFASRSPAHPWLKLSRMEFLQRIGGWRRDRRSNDEGLTVAGLLMFGRTQAIADAAALPKYHVDYRERLTSDPQIRWTDRIWPDGKWEANLFQFFERVYPRLVSELKIPFRFKSATLEGAATALPSTAMQRQDDTIVHEAVREALVNSLIHADYRGQGGVVVERYRTRLEFSNPGSLLVGIDQVLQGGVSECRNTTLQSMFAHLGYGEKAGSGVDKIRQGWLSQKWRIPTIGETHQPERVQWILPMVSLLPEESLHRLRTRFGGRFDSLHVDEVQALVTAEVEGRVNNRRLQQVCTDHKSDITRMLQKLVENKFLEKKNYGRWAYYQLPSVQDLENDQDTVFGSVGSSADSGGSSADSGGSSADSGGSSVDNGGSSPETDERLLAVAAIARERPRLRVPQMRELILELCRSQFLTPSQLATLLGRKADKLRDRYLTPLCEESQLFRKFPNDLNRPDQAYQTNPSNPKPSNLFESESATNE